MDQARNKLTCNVSLAMITAFDLTCIMRLNCQSSHHSASHIADWVACPPQKGRMESYLPLRLMTTTS